MLIGAVLGALLTYVWMLPPPFYAAEAIIRVPGEEIETGMQLIQSESILAPAAQRSNYALAQLRSEIQVERQGESALIAVRVRTTDQKLAARAAKAAQAVAQVYLAETKDKQEREAGASLALIGEKIAQSEQELAEAEEELQDFKISNAAILAARPEDSVLLEGRLSEMDRRLRLVQAALQQLATLSRGTGEENSFTLFVAGYPPTESLERQLLSMLEKRRDLYWERLLLLRTRTEEAPEVKKLDFQLQELDREIQETGRSLETRYHSLSEELQSERRGVIRRLEQTRAAPQLTHTLETLTRRVEVKTAAWADLHRKLQETEIRQATREPAVVLVREAGEAQVQRLSSYPRVLLGALGGLAMGWLITWLWKPRAPSRKSPQTGILVEQSEGRARDLGIKVLGFIPSGQFAEASTLLSVQLDPESAAAQAYQKVSSELGSLLQELGEKSLLVTSALLQEGKTSLACNLAAALAKSGKRTLLVDANLRSPAIDRVFGLERYFGLSEVLRGVHAWKNMAKPASNVSESLLLLTAGRPVEDPADLVSSELAVKFWKELKAEFDWIVVDAPAALAFPEAARLGSQLACVVLAYQVATTSQELARQARRRLEEAGAKVLGAVLYGAERGFQVAAGSGEIGLQDEELRDIMGLTEE